MKRMICFQCWNLWIRKPPRFECQTCDFKLQFTCRAKVFQAKTFENLPEFNPVAGKRCRHFDGELTDLEGSGKSRYSNGKRVLPVAILAIIQLLTGGGKEIYIPSIARIDRQAIYRAYLAYQSIHETARKTGYKRDTVRAALRACEIIPQSGKRYDLTEAEKTEREAEIVKSYRETQSSKTTAALLGISHRTALKYLKREKKCWEEVKKEKQGRRERKERLLQEKRETRERNRVKRINRALRTYRKTKSGAKTAEILGVSPMVISYTLKLALNYMIDSGQVDPAEIPSRERCRHLLDIDEEVIPTRGESTEGEEGRT